MPPLGRHGLLVNTDISKQELAYPCAKNSNLTKLEVKEGVCGMPAVTEIEGSSQLVSEAVSVKPARVRSMQSNERGVL